MAMGPGMMPGTMGPSMMPGPMGSGMVSDPMGFRYDGPKTVAGMMPSGMMPATMGMQTAGSIPGTLQPSVQQSVVKHSAKSVAKYGSDHPDATQDAHVHPETLEHYHDSRNGIIKEIEHFDAEINVLLPQVQKLRDERYSSNMELLARV